MSENGLRLLADAALESKLMQSKYFETQHRILSGFARSPVEQATENLAQALRALDLVPRTSSELMPHPILIVRSEIENARRYLELIDPPYEKLAS